MTTISVFRKADGTLMGFASKGHSGYAQAGEDIVCAGISALTQTFLNGIVHILQAPAESRIDEEGAQLTVRLLEPIAEDKMPGAQLLLRTFVEGVQAMAAGYPRQVRVIFQDWRERKCSS